VSIGDLKRMERRNVDVYLPDSNIARALNLGTRCSTRACALAPRRMRAGLTMGGASNRGTGLPSPSNNNVAMCQFLTRGSIESKRVHPGH
jgi:hypothetical protein